MAEIARFFTYRHLRSEASSSSIAFKRGRRTRSGRGLAFWFNPIRTSIMEIPADDRDTDFVFQARSRDYQVVSVLRWRRRAPVMRPTVGKRWALLLRRQVRSRRTNKPNGSLHEDRATVPPSPLRMSGSNRPRAAP